MLFKRVNEKCRVSVLATFAALLFSGCGFFFEPVLVPNKNMQKAVVFDPNDYEHITITPDQNGEPNLRHNTSGLCENLVSVPFCYSEYTFLGWPSVKGQINGKSYPFIFDTGCNPYIIIEDRHVHENQMPVYFFEPDNKNSSFGYAIANQLSVGSLEYEDFPCFFWKHHAQINFLGLPLTRTRDVMMPLRLMKKFKYFAFDRVDNQLRFSPLNSFETNNQSEWITFPFHIQSGKLLLTISIEGVKVTWFLDTGSTCQLKLDGPVLQQLYAKRPDLKATHKTNSESFLPYSGGKKQGQQFTAKNLDFGDGFLKTVNIRYEADSENNELYQGTIGFGLFEKTVMVLDFEKSIMWVKKSKFSRFEK